MAKKLTKKDLVVAYKELDKVIGIEPPIEYEDLKQDEFEEELYKTYVDLVEEGDEFSKPVQATFDALAEKYGNAEEDQDDEEDEEDEIPEPDEDDEDEDDEDEEEEPVKPAPKGKAKGKEKPKPEPEPEEDEDEDEDDEPVAKPVKKGKPEKAPKAEKAPKVEKPKKEKKEKLESTRADNFAEIWNEGVAYSRGEWVDKMMELYPKKTGKVPAQVHFAAYSAILLKLGFMKKTKDDKFVKAK